VERKQLIIVVMFVKHHNQTKNKASFQWVKTEHAVCCSSQRMLTSTWSSETNTSTG